MTVDPEFIGSIFTPDHPVEDPSLLYGRVNDIRQVFAVYGSSYAGLPIVTGPPGIGKTSVLAIFSQALVGLVDENTIPGAWTLMSKCRRFVIYVRCDNTMAGPEELSAEILQGVASQVGGFTKRRAHRLKSVEVSASFPIVGAKATWDAADQPKEAGFTRNLEARVEGLIESGVADEVTVIVDECEQLPWLPDLLQYTRQFLGGRVRFCFGLRDYAATRVASGQRGDYRWPTWVPLSALGDNIVRDFYQNATDRLADVGILWRLNDEVVARVARLSSGEPWYWHMVGWALLYDPQTAIETPVHTSSIVRRVTLGDLSRAESQVIRGRLYGLHGALYSELCATAPAREQVVRALARFPDTIIPMAFVRHIARKRVSSARRIVEYLLNCEPPILLSDGVQRSLQFVDHQFRVFARLSAPEHAGSDEFARQLVESWLG